MNGLQSLRPILQLFFRTKGTALYAGIAAATATVLAGIALLGLSGWFITATAIAGLSVATAVVFDVLHLLRAFGCLPFCVLARAILNASSRMMRRLQFLQRSAKNCFAHGAACRSQQLAQKACSASLQADSGYRRTRLPLPARACSGRGSTRNSLCCWYCNWPHASAFRIGHRADIALCRSWIATCCGQTLGKADAPTRQRN